MERHRLPHACLLCAPLALPFRNLWEARRHVREDHDIGDAFPEEFLRMLDESAGPPSAPRIQDVPPFICLHCLATGRFELRNTTEDMDGHYRNYHVEGREFDRMGISKPTARYEEDYLSDADRKNRIERKLATWKRQLEAVRTTTDFFTELGLGFYQEGPEGNEDAGRPE